MSFLKSNQYYILNFRIELSKLSDLEEVEYYKTKKVDFRERIENYYIELDKNKFEFYVELLEVLGKFESEYIFQNLLLENNAFELLDRVVQEVEDKNIAFETRYINDILKQYKNFNNKAFLKKHPNKDLVFLVKLLHFYIKDLDDKDLDVSISGINGISRKIVKFISKKEIDKSICYILIIKLWQYFIQDIENFSFKSIVFYKELANLEHELFLDVNVFRKTIEVFLEALFVDIKFSPLHDNPMSIVGEESENLKSIYKTYIDRIENIGITESFTTTSNFIELFQALDTKESLKHTIFYIVKGKIDEFEYPNKNEILFLQSLIEEKGGDLYFDKLKSLLYRYEF